MRDCCNGSIPRLIAWEEEVRFLRLRLVFERMAMTVLENLERVIAYLNRHTKDWKKLEEDDVDSLTDAEVKARMGGHAMWDDPPAGYDEAKLLLWSRGYLRAENVHSCNTTTVIEAAISMPGGLNDICEGLRKFSPGGGWLARVRAWAASHPQTDHVGCDRGDNNERETPAIRDTSGGVKP